MNYYNVFIIGLGIVTCLFFHSLFYYIQGVSADNKNRIIPLSFICATLSTIFGICLVFVIRFEPSILNDKNCISHFQPVILLIPTLFPLGYYCIMSLFQMINAFTVDMDQHLINEKNAWTNLIFSIIKFAGLLFASLWYCYLIYVAFGQYKIAKKRARNLLLSETRPLPPHQCHSQTSLNMQDENLNDSSEII